MWRYLARRATTGEWLHWDVALATDGPSWALSAPGTLSGTIAPELGGLIAEDGRLVLEEWGTLLYAEHGGVLRWGGIVTRSQWSGEQWGVEAAGFSTYPHSRVYRGEYVRDQVDPAEVIEHIWAHVQSFPDSDLGVQVVGDSTPVLLGELAFATDPAGNRLDPVEHAAEIEREGYRITAADPYMLVWWEAVNCGKEIADITSSTPLDYIERVAWASGDEVTHEIVIGYPRIGRRREDLAFEYGTNVLDIGTVQTTSDEHANSIIGLGAGEGRAVLMRQTARRDGRLTRDYVYSDKSVQSAPRMDAFIDRELTMRAAGLKVTSLTVSDHSNAPLGSWSVGDDVLLRADLPWLGEVELWLRVTGWQVSGDGAVLSVERSDTFRYGGA